MMTAPNPPPIDPSATGSRARARRPRGRELALALLTLLGTMVMLEAAARRLHTPAPLTRVYDPFAYRIPQPGLEQTFPGLDGAPVTIRLNELGMRGPSIQAPVAPGTRTVLFLGGSTTENYGYPLEQTFPELCGRRLEASIGAPIRVFNAGMSAATTSTSLARLQHQVIDLEPDLVVVMNTINDLVSGFHTDYRRDGRHLPRPQTADSRPASYLLDWMQSRRLRSQPAGPRSPGPRPSGPIVRRLDYSDFPARQVFARNLRSMAAIAAAHGIPLLFLSEGSMYATATADEARDRFRMVDALNERGMPAPDQASLEAGMRAFNGLVLASPALSGVHAFDLASSVPATWEMYYDDCHLTRAGNTRVAEALAPELERILRLGR